MENTRPYKAGKSLARSIIEMINLMYQNATAEKFILALHHEILKEMERRKIRSDHKVESEYMKRRGQVILGNHEP